MDMVRKRTKTISNMRLKEIQGRYQLYVDLDGVLADFIRGIKQLVPDYSEEKFEADSEYRSMMWTVVKKFQDEGNELWYNLNLLPDALELWHYIEPHNPEILSATGPPLYNAADQKARWVHEHISRNVKLNFTHTAANKAQYAAPNHILIDDKLKALNPWRAAGGIGVLHTSANSTITELKKIGL